MCKTVVVIGAGISGLSLGYYWKKKFPSNHLLILEKNNQAGGVIGTFKTDEHQFDKGPKTLKVTTSKEFLDLAGELDLTGDLVYSLDSAKNRYLYYQKQIIRLPTSLKDLLFSSVFRPMIFSLIKEMFVKKRDNTLETIGEFARRRFGYTVAQVLFEPFVRGIVGADMDKVSLKETFPQLAQIEKEKGSIIKSFLKKKQIPDKRLISLKGGIHQIIEGLELKMKNHLCKNEEVLKISNEGIVTTSKREIRADLIFCALPFHCLPELLDLDDSFYQKEDDETLIGVSFAMEKKASSYKGFGYLVPQIENQPILGVIFDSEIFKKDSSYDYYTVLMKNYSNMDHKDIAYKALCAHLQSNFEVASSAVFYYDKALFSYSLEAVKKISELKKSLEVSHPFLKLCGHYLHPPGVNHCIKYCKTLVDEV